MKEITLELSEEQFARLERAAEWSRESLAGLLKTWVVDLLDDPIDPFARKVQRRGDQDRDFQRRIA